MKEANNNKCLTMTVGEVQQLLGLGRTATYDLVDQAKATCKPFRVICIGRSVKIVRKSFDAWIAENGM